MDEYKGCAFITKKAYKEFHKLCEVYISEPGKYEEFLTNFKRIFKFDPDKSSCSPETVKKVKEKRDKLKAEGISTYVSSGAKKFYEKKKMAMNDTKK